MKTVINRDPTCLRLRNGPCAVTIGNFDGVHLGHQEVLKRLSAHPGTKIVISFYPHPGVVLGKAPAIPHLTTLRQKRDLFSTHGVDILYLIHFTKGLSNFSAAQFLDRYMISSLKASDIVLGPDTALGKNREGDSQFIEQYLKSKGIKCETITFLDIGGSRVSSRRIRSLISDGDVVHAEELLGRKFELDARIVKGAGRGRTIGIPTANLELREQLIPKLGVYATVLIHAGKRYPSVTNVGVRPTFHGVGQVSVEAHVPGVSLNLYGQRIALQFVQRIRDEMKFTSAQALKAQIERDIVEAHRLIR